MLVSIYLYLELNLSQIFRNNISFAPRSRPSKSMTANLVVESTQSIVDDLRAIFNILILPYHVRIGKHF